MSTRVGTVPIRHRRHRRSANATTASGRPQARVTGSSPIIGPASPASALNVAAAESATKPGASVSSRRTDSVSWYARYQTAKRASGTATIHAERRPRPRSTSTISPAAIATPGPDEETQITSSTHAAMSPLRSRRSSASRAPRPHAMLIGQPICSGQMMFCQPGPRSRIDPAARKPTAAPARRAEYT